MVPKMHIESTTDFLMHLSMPGKFLYPPAEAAFYRGIERTKVNQALTPWGVKYSAFRRRANETDGPAILPAPYLCYRLDIDRVACVHVGELNAIRNPENSQPLTVIQWEAERAFIANVPAFLSRAKAIEDCATEIAEMTELLPVVECERAKKRWDSLAPARPPGLPARKSRPA